MTSASRAAFDRILVDGVKLGKDPAQHGPEHVGRRPGDPVGPQQPLGQRRLADPRCAADRVEAVATHPSIMAGRTALPLEPGGRTRFALRASRTAPSVGLLAAWSPTAMAVRQACPGGRHGGSSWQDHDRRQPQQRQPGRPGGRLASRRAAGRLPARSRPRKRRASASKVTAAKAKPNPFDDIARQVNADLEAKDREAGRDDLTRH